MSFRSALSLPARVSDQRPELDRSAGTHRRAMHGDASWAHTLRSALDPFYMSARRLEQIMDQLDGFP
ncbi:MAG: hypothetical protein AAF865_13970 [Pseudomonadota bacterium]